jgi:hypothetical protein
MPNASPSHVVKVRPITTTCQRSTVTCVTALVESLTELPGVSRVVSLRLDQGEVELEGWATEAEITAATIRASSWIAELRAEGFEREVCASL